MCTLDNFFYIWLFIKNIKINQLHQLEFTVKLVLNMAFLSTSSS